MNTEKNYYFSLLLYCPVQAASGNVVLVSAYRKHAAEKNTDDFEFRKKKRYKNGW